jgi:hemerythrin-like domain-containing protein
MTGFLNRLLEDHRHMRTLLKVFSEELDNFKNGQILDYVLLSSVLDYLTRKTQLNHHQVEDKMFELLAAKNIKGLEIDDILAEHEKLAFLCNTLRDALRDVEQDMELPRMWVVSVAQEYLTAQQRHMRSEEKSLFPAARTYLVDDDWRQIFSMALRDTIDLQLDLQTLDLDNLRNDIIAWHQENMLSN